MVSRLPADAREEPAAVRVSTRRETDNNGIGTAQSVGEWTRACFPAGDTASESELLELIQEAADAARDDFDASSAKLWAAGYTFPAEYLSSDVRC